MARKDCRLLDTGDPFPEFSMNTVDGGTINLPGDFKGKWVVFLIYRGNW